MQAIDAREAGEKRTILFCLSGHGYFDMSAYDNYLSGDLQDSSITDEMMQEILKKLS